MKDVAANVIDIQFGKKKESFDEFSARSASEIRRKRLPPDAEIERQALLAVMEGRLSDAERLGNILVKRNQFGIARVK